MESVQPLWWYRNLPWLWGLWLDRDVVLVRVWGRRVPLGNLVVLESQTALVAPVKELHDRPTVGRAGVFVSDPRDKELHKLPAGVVAGVVDDRRQA